MSASTIDPTMLLAHSLHRSNVDVKKAIKKGTAVEADCGTVWVPRFQPPPAGTPSCPRCHPESLPHFVYRYFDATGALLYVGCTRRPIDRDKQHRQSAAWYCDVVSVRRTVYPNRKHALAIEAQAIREEGPLHNRTGRGPKK